MEQVINVPMAEGVTQQYIIGLSALENGIEVFTNAYIDNGDGTGSARYYRHTILDDGTTTTADEPWLNELAQNAANELQVIRAADGALYMFFAGFYRGLSDAGALSGEPGRRQNRRGTDRRRH